ncbi:MAG: PKD domain-containing protein, partial [Gammaproteobacteria bacterium]|nr:PKD domain-containing protein [Gammaproteobacteria bacterium]MDE1984884.1 PKD domain-containing protein [Gammaproteobacteria bacterium]MDE2109489.1 PKD domain-containing protein [Gammaproteobacteria bacterium]MDE2459930.1 PKD domain-containing protein [Gammaproteobacteria bacterium]
SGSTTITAGQSVNFSGTCSANGAPGTVGYDWNFGASSGVADSTAQNPTATYQFFGQYTVTLTCTNQFGVNNATPATVSVTVNPATAPPPSSGKGGGGGGVDIAMLLLLLLSGALKWTGRDFE